MRKTTTKQMSRRIPAQFHVQFQDGVVLEEVIESLPVRKFVIEQTVVAIQEGYKKKQSSITLFSVLGTQCVVELDKYQWKQSLQSALSFYEECEEWDKCIEVRDLMNKL